MHKVGVTGVRWEQILDLAGSLDSSGQEGREEDQITLAKLVLDFDRNVVRYAKRQLAAERTSEVMKKHGVVSAGVAALLSRGDEDAA